MRNAALYFPYIHIRSDRWIKAAALYWPTLLRIVPPKYGVYDSRVVRILTEELGLIQNIFPTGAIEAAGDHLATVIDADATKLEALYRVPPNWGVDDMDRTRGAWARALYPDPLTLEATPGGGSTLTGIHSSELSPQLQRCLTHHGLAIDVRQVLAGFSTDTNLVVSYRGRAIPFELEAEIDREMGEAAEITDRQIRKAIARHNRRALGLENTDDTWYAVDPGLAWEYMSLLANEVARRNQLTLTTDEVAAQAATANRRVLERDVNFKPDTFNPMYVDYLRADLPTTIGMLALECVVPKDLTGIPPQKIAKLRQRYAEEFDAFLDAVDDIATELKAESPTLQDEAILEVYLRDNVQRRLILPKERLQKALRSARVEPAMRLMNAKYEVPAMLGIGGGLLTNQPIVAGGAAVAAAIVAARESVVAKRKTLREADMPSSYLLAIGQTLNSPSNSRTLVSSAAGRLLSSAKYI